MRKYLRKDTRLGKKVKQEERQTGGLVQSKDLGRENLS
jgi:hypothetical protein